MDELSDEVDRAEFNGHSLKEKLDSLNQDISGMERELEDVKPGIEFIATFRKIESKVDYCESELEYISSDLFKVLHLISLREYLDKIGKLF